MYAVKTETGLSAVCFSAEILSMKKTLLFGDNRKRYKQMLNTITNIEAAIAPSFLPEVFDQNAISIRHEISTARLCLRPVNNSDLIEYVELFSDPKVMRFVGIEAGYIPSYQEIEQIHQNAVQVWKTRGYGRWSLFDSKTGDFAGFCGFRSEQGVPELIAAFHKKFWNRGLAVEAATACLQYGFNSLGFTEVKAFTRPDHSRAKRVLEKLNAHFIGYLNFHGVEGAAYLLMPDSTI